MKEIKIIDLLKKIVNDDYDLPKKIKFRDVIYTKTPDNFTYWVDEPSNTLRIDTIDLNRYVEIVEDEVKEMTVDEISEKLGYKVKVVGLN